MTGLTPSVMAQHFTANHRFKATAGTNFAFTFFYNVKYTQGMILVHDLST